MRADVERNTVTISVSDPDFELAEGVKSSVTVVGGVTGDKYENLAGKTWADILTYTGDLEFVDDKDISNVSGSKVEVSYTVSKRSGASWVEVTDSAEINALFNGSVIATDYRILVDEVVIDYLHNRWEVGAGNYEGDGKDDREQTIVTIKEEGWDHVADKATGKYTEAEYTVNDDKSLETVIKALPGYDEVYVVGDDGDVYERVYYIKGNTVTGDFEKNPSKKIVNGTPASDVVYDELDTNHDGVVSCDEAHGEGWVWNEDKKACVYIGSTTSTVIVNTATK